MNGVCPIFDIFCMTSRRQYWVEFSSLEKKIKAALMIVSFAAVFRDVTQRSPERRDIPKDGCEGEYSNEQLLLYC